jgi:hypothetical protein
MASPEEAMAVQILSKGKIPLREIMRRGDAIYGNVDFVHKVFKHKPEVRKAIYDEMTKEYLARGKKAATKRVPLKPMGSGSKIVPAVKKQENVTFQNVGSLIRKSLREQESEED